MLLKFKAKAKSLRPNPKGPEAKAEVRGHEAESQAEAKTKIGFNISANLLSIPEREVAYACAPLLITSTVDRIMSYCHI